MSADIRLDGDWLVLEGNWTRVRSWDLMLDAADRRQSDQGWRRALVHDQQDGLTINYAGDYPGGVTIKGTVSVDRLEGQKLTASSLETSSAKVGEFTLGSSSVQGLHIGDNVTNTYIRGQLVRVEKNFQVDGEANFLEKITARDVCVKPELTPENETDSEYQPYSLFDRIRAMQQTINDLKERVATLEGQ